jgi:hypothetical protein
MENINILIINTYIDINFDILFVFVFILLDLFKNNIFLIYYLFILFKINF